MRDEPGLQDERYWPGLADVPPCRPGEALDLLEANARAGATIIAIGPYTNLAVLEVARPGAFAHCPVVVMGGFTGVAKPGLPQWGPRMDYNVQSDRIASRIVFDRVNPLIVPLGVTFPNVAAATAPFHMPAPPPHPRPMRALAVSVARPRERQSPYWPGVSVPQQGSPDGGQTHHSSSSELVKFVGTHFFRNRRP